MTNKNPNREAAHNERKPASDQPTAQRKPSEAPGLITRSAYSAEPSRRAAPRTKGPPGRDAPPAGPLAPRSADVAHAPPSAPRDGKGAFRRPPKRGKARRGTSPRPLSAHMKSASSAATPCPPQPRAAVLSAKAGLTAGFGMGPVIPASVVAALGGAPAAQVFEPARSLAGRPGGRMAGTGEDGASRSVLVIEDAKSSGH